jgi:hypothetical protein
MARPNQLPNMPPSMRAASMMGPSMRAPAAPMMTGMLSGQPAPLRRSTDYGESPRMARGNGNGLKTSGTYKGKSNALGGGGRFQQIEDKARASGAKNPAAVAAAVGRKSLGAAKMAKLAAAGRKRAK